MAEGHAKPNHDYHLVPLSPWPLVGSISAFVMAVGGITWMKAINAAGPYIFGAGVIGVLFTMVAWWTDVVREAEHGDHTRVVQISHRYGMILFIASEVMFFVAWFWAYFDIALYPHAANEYARAQAIGGVWPPKGIEPLDPWHFPLLNTLLLLTSGTTVTWAHHALLHSERSAIAKGLILTIVLGVLFTCVQVWEYAHAPFPFASAMGSNFYMPTGFHGFHVFIGTVFLLVCLARVAMGQFTTKQHLGFEFAAWYWHFVDVVWLFLFSCIYVWGSWGAATDAVNP